MPFVINDLEDMQVTLLQKSLCFRFVLIKKKISVFDLS